MRRLANSFGLSAALILTSAYGLGQVTLSLASGSGIPGSTVALNLSLNASSSSQAPASLQWVINYSTTDFSAISVVAGSAATAATKSLSCNNVAGTSTCLVYGVNTNTISSGVVATVNLTVSAATKNTSSAVQFTSGMASSVTGGLISSTNSGTSVTIVQSSTIPVTVQSATSGASFVVDGTTYTSTQVLNWTPGSSHTLSSTSPQSGGTGIQYVWSSWSDGGAMTHTVAPTTATTYTANFTTQYYLTTAASPTAGGSISPASGWYNSGATASVSATANSGYTFSGFSGALTGTTTPQTLTMTAPETVTASYQASTSSASGTAFITGYSTAGRAVRNNFGGWVGTQFTVGSSSLTVTAVGRLCLSGNSSLHTVEFVSVATGTAVTGGSAVVNMAGCTAGQFVYTSLPAAITLAAGASYYLASMELSGGDTWYDTGAITTTTVASASNSIYNSGAWVPYGGANTSYVPPNFLYTSGAAFVTGYTTTGRTVRNNFAGWLGTQFTVGSASLSVTSVGRLCLSGNSSTHTVKFTSAANGQDVTGGSAVVNMAGCTAGQFVYASLAAPITLQAGASYYLTSLEVSGGDTWYDSGAITAASAASVTSSIYYSGAWTAFGSANTAYVPPNFLYSSSGSSSISVTVQSATSGASFAVDGTTYTSTQVFNWTPGSSHTLSSTSPQSSGTGVQFVWTSWSDGGAMTHTVAPTTATTYTANFTTQYYLTTAASPTAGGSISPASGWYNSGATASVSATANSGYTFSGFSGALTGTTTPQTLTMTAPETVTADYQASTSSPSGTAFITGYSTTGRVVRNNFGGWVGTEFTVGSASLSVTAVGRLCLSGNSSTHAVEFVNAATGTAVTGGSATVNMAGCTAGQFVYTPLPAAITLQAATSYYLASMEVSGGDTWYDTGAITTTADGSATNSIYNNGAWTGINGANTAYVPPNFLYSLAGKSFITGYTTTGRVVRNNYSGWVGTEFTVGSTSLNVTSVGRACLTGNSGTHAVEFVNPATGQAVTGGSATVNMAGCTAGQFVYTALPAAIVLQASTTYYLVSMEASGGDTWYDSGAVTTTADGSVSSSIYNDGVWTPYSGVNTAYVPPNFLYTLSSTSGTAFITGVTTTGRTVRNNYSGWVGTQLTVGSTSMTVISVGRLCLSGDSSTHSVKFTAAATGQDVTGGSATVNMAGCTAGQFVYTALAAPIVLQAGTSYYLSSLEVSGGDSWYDFGPVTTTSAGSVTNSIYNSGNWISMGTADTSYVPPNFQYHF